VTVLERVGIAAAVLIGGYVLAVAARALARRLLRSRQSALGPSFVRLVCGSVYYDLLALTVGAALIALGVPAPIVVGIGVAILIVVAIALQESVADLAATVLFLVFQPFKRGELVETLGHVGYVHELLAFTTVLQLPDERLVTLANRKVHEEGVVNYSRAGRVRVEVGLSVSYDTDLDRVRSVLTDVAAGDPRVLGEPAIVVAADELAESGVRLHVEASVTPADYLDVGAGLRERIKARFDAEHIPFVTPILDIRTRRPSSSGDQPG
jgi:small conductance mechanosensitive channel